MNESDFISNVADFVENRLRSIKDDILHQRVKVNYPYSFPTLLRVGQTQTHYIAELCGCVDLFHCSCTVETPNDVEKFADISHFFLPGFVSNNLNKPIINIETSNSSIEHLTICTSYDQEDFLQKFHFPLFPTVLIRKDGDIPIQINPKTNGIIFLGFLDLIRSEGIRVFFRSVSNAFIVNKVISRRRLNLLLHNIFDYKNGFIRGLNAFDASSESFAKELASFTDQDISETMIDRFIQTNKDYFAKALKYVKALSQKKLFWTNRRPDDPTYSIPDYLMEREDGYFDILDLKKGLLMCNSITTGGRKRCRFKSYVADLIAQLDGYKRYFENPDNSKWALEHLGIRVKNPNLIGIVGSYNTFDREEVELALRQYIKNISLFSYTDISNLLRIVNDPGARNC